MLPVWTRHAVSDNNSKSGLGMPSPYIPEREQIQDDEVGLKLKTIIPPPRPPLRSLVVTKFATPPAPALYAKENKKLGALGVICVQKNS